MLKISYVKHQWLKIFIFDGPVSRGNPSFWYPQAKFQLREPHLRGKTQFWDPIFFQFYLFFYIYFTSTIHVSSFIKIKKFEFWSARLGEPPFWNPQFLLGLDYF